MDAKTKKTKGIPDSVDIHVGDRLRTRRSLLGMSQEKLADAVGITFQQIQKYERGLNRISAGRLYQFSKILDVPVSYFFENAKLSGSILQGLSDNEQEKFQGDVLSNKESIDLLRLYYSIKDENMRKSIHKFIKSLSEALQKNSE